MRSPILPPKCTNFLKRFIKQREIRFSLQDSKRPKGLRLFDFFPNKKVYSDDLELEIFDVSYMRNLDQIRNIRMFFLMMFPI